MDETTTIGAEFAEALAVKDFDRIRELLDPEIDFRGLTPNRVWDANDPESVITGVLQHWFEEVDEIQSLEELETGTIVNRERVGYRFKVQHPDGPYLVEQQAYLEVTDGRISWMRVVCSGALDIPA
jgi:hypothetical protein